MSRAASSVMYHAQTLTPERLRQPLSSHVSWPTSPGSGTVWNVWGENILIGGPGNDGFTVTKGSGPRTLFAGTTDGSGEIRVGEGISQSEIRVERVGDDMVVRIDNSDDRLTIVNHFAAPRPEPGLLRTAAVTSPPR